MITNIKYVLGFAYTPDNKVLLIKKNKPEWQKGKLNGIGGKIELNETPLEAMNRETLEESGLKLTWQAGGVIKGASFECYVFYTCDSSIQNYQQKEEEILNLYSLDSIKCLNCIDNVPSLINIGIIKLTSNLQWFNFYY